MHDVHLLYDFKYKDNKYTTSLVLYDYIGYSWNLKYAQIVKKSITKWIVF